MILADVSRRSPQRRTLAATFSRSFVMLGLSLRAGTAFGAEPERITDGVYGRFDGDLDVSLAAGATVGPGGPSAAFLARANYFHTAGIYLAYTDALGRSGAALPRSLGLGVSLRPFFIPRWAFDLERGPAILDLTIDAITFDLGVLWPANAEGSLAEPPGIEAALGTEVPLLGSAYGPFLGARGALRWRSAELGGASGAALDPALFLTLSWHTIVDAHLADAGDRRLR
jgi:hypothetical protein